MAEWKFKIIKPVKSLRLSVVKKENEESDARCNADFFQ